jgi:Kef-type K+ transport system membrane component KefB
MSYVLRSYWTLDQAMIAASLSTTSMRGIRRDGETGLNRKGWGLSHLLFTDLGTVVAGILFAHYDLWLVLFAVVTTLVLCLTPSFARWFFKTFNGHVSEPEIKLLFLLIFGLGWLATRANSEAVLPAYLLGGGSCSRKP